MENNKQADEKVLFYSLVDSGIDLKNEELKQFKSKVFDMIEAFINGIKDEKGIDDNNQQFQAEMDRALKYMKAIKRELEKDD